MKIVYHIVTVIVILGLFFALPAVFSVDMTAVNALFTEDPDAVSSASVIITDQPSGNFVILLNRDRLGKNTEVWTDFFSDREVPVIMQDIVCRVMSGDSTASELARTYVSRLPANQMKVKEEAGLMTASKAECGMFDVLICSAEFSDAFSLLTVFDNDGIIVLEKASSEEYNA